MITRIGTLEFFDGIPTKETAELVYDNLDFHRGVEAFLNGVPAASLEALRFAESGNKPIALILYTQMIPASKQRVSTKGV